MSKVPPGWALATVGDIAELSDGPFGSNLKTSHYVEEGPRVIRLQNIGDGVFRDERAHISAEHFAKLSKHSVSPGDVVAASLGENAPRACLVPEWLGPALVKADCIRIRTCRAVESAYLMWMLNSPPVRQQAARSIKGIGRPRLGLGGIRNLMLPIPPIAEQRRIVAAIEERLSRLDAASEGLQRLLARVDGLRTAALAQMPREGEVEPIADLLEKNIGGTWGVPPGEAETDVLVLRVTEFRAHGEVDPSTGATRSVTAAQLESRRLHAGDLLVEKSGGSTDRPVGRVGWVPQIDQLAVPANFIQLLRVDLRKAEARYVFYWLMRLHAFGVAAQYQRATTNIRNLKTQDYLREQIPVPGRERQTSIADQLDECFALASRLEEAIGRVLREAQRLRRAILASAFRGELVAQDSDDEPASVLLDQIAAERAAAPKRSRVRKEKASA